MLDEDPLDDRLAPHEWKLRLVAIPAAFAIALAFHAWPTGHWLQRTFLTMIPHELGHAVTAWFCGYTAVPSVWKTLVPEARGVIAPVLVGALNAYLLVRAWNTQGKTIAAIAIALVLAQLVGTFVIEPRTASMAITFGGDAGAMVIGTLLVLAFFAPAGSKLRQGGLRWGLLAIGAATLVDTFATWWTARHDVDAIPFGEIEGVGLSDPSKLEQLHGWTPHQMIDRYTTLGLACLLVIAVVWAWGTSRARRDVGGA
ncbi:MAG TPA: hypothetical protein VFQ53_42505 [Kofleriaceae bacterium]|nr:hypothetical protein [Kofleriaceae bacterium]